MNKILKFIFDQWQEDRFDGKAETLALNRFCNTEIYSVEDANKNSDYLYEATNEVAERAFLVGLKDLVDGKAAD